MTQPTALTHNEGHDNHGKTPIFIDEKQYSAPEDKMTGAELRRLGGVTEAYDLFLEVPGPAPDRLIRDTDVVEIKPGMHFFTVPRDLNPGGINAIAGAR